MRVVRNREGRLKALGGSTKLVEQTSGVNTTLIPTLPTTWVGVQGDNGGQGV